MKKSNEILVALLTKGRDLIGFSGVSRAAMRRLADDLTLRGVIVQSHGKWEFVNDYESRCTNCGENSWINHEKEHRFCPNCGARMNLDDPKVKSLVERQGDCIKQNLYD